MPPTKEQCRMASFMNLHPDMPETWPMEMLDRLIHIEKQDGREHLYRELGRMMSPDFRG